MNTTERIGVYVCECGPNIKDALDIDAVVTFAQGLDNVVLTRLFGLLCSGEGQDLIVRDIKEHDLTRVVIAACSPKEHEMTFRETLKKGGLNPFLLQIANIREQCAWVIGDKGPATEKSKAMIAAAVKRVVHHEPLEKREIECQADVLVVGAGMAGISAAMALAQKNRKVYLIEKSPCIGGKVARYEDVFPTMECASCLLDPILDEVLHDEQVQVLTLGEVQEVLGFYGNFTVRVNKKARFVNSETCIGCGACLEVCPVKVENEYNEGLDKRGAIYIPYAGALPNVAVIDKGHCLRWKEKECNACEEACPFGSIDYEAKDEVAEFKVGAIVLATGFDLFDPRRAPVYGYGKIDNVFTSLEFERLVSSTGPTQGKILLKNGDPPKEMALVHCVGSRTEKFNRHCSGVCCMYMLKFAHQAMKKLPGVRISALYSDFCLPGKSAQPFFDTVSKEKGLQFFHMKEPGAVTISEKGGKVWITYRDVLGEDRTISTDMVVLAPAIEGTREDRELAEVFDVSQGEDGFFVEEDSTVAPVSTVREGVFVAGCAQGPKDIPGAVAQGQAAAGAILSGLVPGEKLALEAMTAEVDDALCCGCKICVGLCPYKAIAPDYGETRVSINQVLCRGCGVCPAACPSGAIKAHHFTDEQISAEIKGLVKPLWDERDGRDGL